MSAASDAAVSSSSERHPVKYILVTGGVISGVGKGVISSSLGVILQRHGLTVTAIKIDPYINIDAGTFSPYEHGEVFVLDDGSEVDLDLGNYERFLDIRLGADNNITTGKIYDQVIRRERKGDYLGKTVQVIPHITDAIQDWVQRVANTNVLTLDGQSKPVDVCIIELGGVVGDIESMAFVEAFRKFQNRVHRDNFMNVHVSLILEPNSTGEQKTKPTQNSVRELRCLGLFPDLVFCRSQFALTAAVQAKLADVCEGRADQVISVRDVPNIYHVPLLLNEQCVLRHVVDRLSLQLPERASEPTSIGDYMSPSMRQWQQLALRSDDVKEEVCIALVGKYVELEDAYTSVIKALKHGAIAAGRKLTVLYVQAEHLQDTHKALQPAQHTTAWTKLKSAKGVLVPGGFGERGIEGKIAACNWARVNKIPFLGICLGMQCAAIEFARNVLMIDGAHSTEFKQSGLAERQRVVIDMPEHNAADKGMGATMRLGKRTTVLLTRRSVLAQLYGRTLGSQDNLVDERHRHRYEVNPAVVPSLSEAGCHFVGMGVDEQNTTDVITGSCTTRSASSQQLMAMASEPCNNQQQGLVESASSNSLEDVVMTDNNGANVNEEWTQLNARLRRLCHDQVLGKDRPVRMEMLELNDHPYYVGVQFHPEYLSHPLRPSAPYLGLLLAASGQLNDFVCGRAVPSPLVMLNPGTFQAQNMDAPPTKMSVPWRAQAQTRN